MAVEKHYCCICGEETDGFIRWFIFITRWYCRKDFPLGISNIEV